MNTTSTRAFVSQFLAFTLSMLFVTGSIGLGTVWLRHEISVTANRTRVLQSRLADVERHINETTAEIASATSTDALLRQNVLMRLGMVQPRPQQVVHMSGSPEQTLEAKMRTDYVRKTSFAPVRFNKAVRIEPESLELASR